MSEYLPDGHLPDGHLPDGHMPSEQVTPTSGRVITNVSGFDRIVKVLAFERLANAEEFDRIVVIK